MFHIKTFNTMAPEGLTRFDENYILDGNDQPDGILLRSQNLHDYAFPDSVTAVARAGAGTNNIPIDQCTERGIVVFNTPGANANAVKELVIASLLLSVRPILRGAKWVQTLIGADVEEQVEAQKKQFAGTELEGKRLGVIGLGAIGAMVANDAYRLGMEVVGYDPYVSVDTAWSISRRVKRAAELSEIFTSCDFITVHVPLMENTRHLIDQAALAQMKPTACLFNFSRGEIVDTDAVVTALDSEKLASFTTDFASEKLLGHEKILVLPHLGASTEEAEVNCAKMATETIKRFLETGTITNSVNFPSVDMAFYSPHRLTVIHKNIPNMLGQISSTIAELGINIENMVNRGQKEHAYTLVDVQEDSWEKVAQVADRLKENPDIIRVRVITQPEGGY